MYSSSRFQQGFSLIEVLVAFSIMAMSVGLLYRALGGSAHDVQILDTQLQASVLAQSVLSLKDAVPPEGWAQSGASGSFEWQVQSIPYTVPEEVIPPNQQAAPEGSPSNPRLHEVQLLIGWQERSERKVWKLNTLLPVIQTSSTPL